MLLLLYLNDHLQTQAIQVVPLKPDSPQPVRNTTRHEEQRTHARRKQPRTAQVLSVQQQQDARALVCWAVMSSWGVKLGAPYLQELPVNNFLQDAGWPISARRPRSTRPQT